MGIRPLRVALLVILLGFFLVAAPNVSAGWEWSVKNELDLKSPALDMIESGDGEWLFILTAGALQVYSFQENRIVLEIPTGQTYDKIVRAPKNNMVALSSSRNHSIKLIQVDFIQKLTYEDRPFVGPPDSPVLLAVFSDYQ